ncbi:nucleotidyltransferase family protein [Actibacterium sp. MT2.3-13A]|uniref:nucleotidyltransferase family protein n=1 Tax=Actibacterium sp. MT2.3-13A TaxID=2828332 RepID=UPI001BA53D15|nr:nucleotidyltransferase family protein [Actibacterium sp. MT2.3-13A]
MPDHPKALMLYAAGFGTRMGALTAARPKPLIEVAGRPLIDHALSLAESAGVAPVVVNAHYRADQIAAHIGDRPGVRISHETPEILDTGGGLRQALPLLGPGPVFTLNTDAAWTGPNPLHTLAAAWDPAVMDALLLLVPRDRARGHAGQGDFALHADGRISRGGGFVYSGAQILRPDGLATIPDRVFSLNLLWDSMLTDQRVFGVVHPGNWCDVGSPEGIAAAEAMLAEARDV